MKQPGSYIPGGIMEICGDWYDELLECVKEAQRDAYNKGIEDSKKAVNSIALDDKSIRHIVNSIENLKIK